MSSLAWLTFGGTEIFNSARVHTYARAAIPQVWTADCADCPDIAEALGDDPYTTPIADGAEWYDPDRPESADFLGAYALEITGIDDSTREANVGQSTGDGGFVSRPRRGTRTVQVRAILLASSEPGIRIGLTWLKSALTSTSCDGCVGDTMCFLAHCPDMSSDAPLTQAIRHLRDVTVVAGPRLVQSRPLSCGGWLMEVEFTLVAATPWIFSEPKVIALAAGVSLTPIAPGTIIEPIDLIPACAVTPPATWGASGLADPDCPPVPEPPKAPSFPVSCGPTPALYFSYAITVPSDVLWEWQDAAVQLRINTGDQDVRQLQVRVVPIAFTGQDPQDVDPCGVCASFNVTYIPSGTQVNIDGMTERVTMQRGNGPVRAADHLVTGVGTELFQFPVLTCGLGYFVIVDVDAAAVIRLELLTVERE